METPSKIKTLLTDYFASQKSERSEPKDPRDSLSGAVSNYPANTNFKFASTRFLSGAKDFAEKVDKQYAL